MEYSSEALHLNLCTQAMVEGQRCVFAECRHGQSC